jgi:hypothetical protein
MSEYPVHSVQYPVPSVLQVCTVTVSVVVSVFLLPPTSELLGLSRIADFPHRRCNG